MKIAQSGRIEETRLPLIGSIREGERRWISNYPQTFFRAKGFAIEDAKAECFVVHDIRVGRNSQLAAPGAFPLEALTGDKAAFLFQTCQVGMVFEMLIENISGRPLSFGILVIGDEPRFPGDEPKLD
jgi:hypothetical protein